LLDQEAQDFLNECCDWTKGKPIPQPPESVIEDRIDECGYCLREEAIEDLTFNPASGSADNDIALVLCNSLFNGERYMGGTSVVEVNTFCKEHGLEVEDCYEGYIY
jgi:hypothetical protein